MNIIGIDLRNMFDFLKDKSVTQRGVSQAVSYIFDPMGFISQSEMSFLKSVGTWTLIGR